MGNTKLFYIQILLILVTSVITGQTTFTVTNTNNDGEGSLAQAIIDANENTGADTIIFREGPHRIQPITTLPAITDPVSILGYSQPGAVKATNSSLAKIMIEIDGGITGDDISGIVIETDNCNIEGIAVHSFGRAGIYVHGSFNVLQGNYIGLSIDGFQPKGNGFRSSDGYYYDGIWIDASSNNLIGGMEPGDKNIISSNASSNIYIGENASVNNIIQGNFIGPAADGKTLLETQSSGIVLFGSTNNIIGGSEEGAGNLISGNDDYGIYIDLGSGSNIIKGNIIGTDISGTLQLGNGLVGIGLANSNGNQIGGSKPGEDNLISGNGHKFKGGGIALAESSSDNSILGNFIGTDITKTKPISNFTYGIFLQDSDNNLVGGDINTDGNLISGTEKIGLFLQSSKNNIIKGNIVGLDYSGTNPIPNKWDGIQLDKSSSNIIGSSKLEEKNIVSGNLLAGISVWKAKSMNNSIIGNNIGTSKDGSELLPNGFSGVAIYASSGNVIGGFIKGEGNIIAGNEGEGVFIKNTTSTNNSSILADDKTTDGNLSNAKDKLIKKHFYKNQKIEDFTNKFITDIINSSNYNISMTKTTAVNLPGNSNSVIGNSIYANKKLGIDLIGIERQNDNEDGDSGTNAGQNHPLIESVTGDGTNATISYSVNSSVSNSAYPLHIEFFIADSSGQGKILLTTDQYSEAEAMTNKSFVFVPSISIGESDYIVATATDSNGNTSEFSDIYLVTSVVGIEDKEEMPNRFILRQNYPNPFNPTTTIKYTIPNFSSPHLLKGRPEVGFVTLKVYDILGREIATLVNKNQKPGNYEVNFNYPDLSSGVYYYILKSGNFVQSKKMTLLK